MSRDGLDRRKPPPKPPLDALEILGRWRLARLVGDRANEYHAIAQLRELAIRDPKRKAGRPDRPRERGSPRAEK
ncbi:MAG TPA: hypothetical protein VKA15_26120 [Isosphaeraceae bacterium]|nr:hypothetical protein [Isosphaeraceae bacterium]